ncbi:EAL domain-containing protein [Vreelandella aquamarina]|uniref:bifunctional diguanylate cyclase/phosphodiesterase n=1 Tax=Vreelandella aquamarina TaxID=77097 RepID=UPI00384FBC26
MVPPASPEHEEKRLLTLKRYTLGDLSADQHFDRITQLAATYCDAPMALITLVDDTHVWIKSSVGNATDGALRDSSFCGAAIQSHHLFEVPDAREDPELKHLPAVTSSPHIVFYAGMPLVADNGSVIGTLCVMDNKPRRLSRSQRELLTQLASNTVLQFEHYSAHRAYHAITNAAIGLWEMDVPSRATHWNEVVNELYDIDKRDARTFEQRMDAYTPEDRTRLISAINTAIEQRVAFNDTFQLVTVTGEPRWVRITGNPLIVDGSVVQLIGTMLDVTPRKRVETQLLRQQALEQAIMRAQASFIDGQGDTKALNPLLEDLLALTSSEYGFIGEVLINDAQAPYLVAHAITDITWDQASKQFYDQNAPDGMIFSNLDTLFGHVMRHEEVVISNTPATDSRRGGLPPGHPPLNAFLGVPIHSHGQCIGMIGLANRPNGYDDALVDFLAPLLGSIGQFINNLRNHRQQRQDQKAIARLSMVAKNTSNGVVITDANGKIEWINDGFTRLSGYTFEEAVGKKPGQLVQGSATEPDTVKRIAHALQHRQRFEEEVLNYHKDGTPYWVHISCNPLPAGEQAGGGFIAIQSDITETKRHAEALYKAANIDELTELPNQRLARTQLEALTQQREPLTVYVLNIDDFKRLNDLFGYPVGNQILKRIAKRLEALVSPLQEQGIAGRLSGDEFVVVAPTQHVSSAALHQIVQQPMEVQGHTLKLTTCIGMTCYPEDEVDSDTLFRHAYQALYQAKTQGVAQCIRYSTDEEHLARLRQQERNAIQHGLANDEFRLFYQPQVDLQSKTVVGAEALIRWQHPTRGLCAPDEFLPLLEGSELEFRLGEWVIEAALQQLQQWQLQGIELQVSVNISPQHLLHQGFLPQLEQLLERYADVPTKLLAIEILESATLDDMQAALHVLENCQRLGIDVALDDFGTGYSSLAYFRRLPVQLIKVDRDFVRDMLESEDDRAIVESIVFLAKKFSRPVLAEGVETQAHAQALLSLGCYLAQGYGIARPMPAEKLPQWLSAWQQEGFADKL